MQFRWSTIELKVASSGNLSTTLFSISMIYYRIERGFNAKKTDEELTWEMIYYRIERRYTSLTILGDGL